MGFSFVSAATAAALVLIGPTLLTSCAARDYEVWAADQSNTAPGQGVLGVKGGLLWIWDGKDVEKQVEDDGYKAVPLPCIPGDTTGPCDILKIFPPELVTDSTPSTALGEMSGFGRLHGALIDPLSKYAALSMFVPGGGYIGIVDTVTKEAIALFRTTRFGFTVNGLQMSGRSVHMNEWSKDGSAIIVSNLEGKAIERINVYRTLDGTVRGLEFDKSATIGLGSDMSVVEHATFFKGTNAFGKSLIGSVAGEYSSVGLQNLTPQGFCKENNCASGSDGSRGGRPINSVICPITSSGGRIYATLTGGGLFVINAKTTPMSIVGEYGREVVYGAGCGGVEVAGKIFVNSGVVGSASGALQSMFAVWAFNDATFPSVSQPQNTPLPDVVFQDPGNTATGGNTVGPQNNTSGQNLGVSTRRDSHGATAIVLSSESYLHVTDRIQGNVEVFSVRTYARFKYDLTSQTGRGGLQGPPGACASSSLPDFTVKNDPSSDLAATTPDQKHVLVALRGPTPVTFGHSSQGSCPGVGVVKLERGGRSGRLVTVLSTSNKTPDTIPVVSPPGGTPYSGIERSDVHGVAVVLK